MSAQSIDNLKAKLEAAYRRRFSPKGHVTVSIGGGGYAYVTDDVSMRKARYDVSAWRIRYVDLVRNGK